MIDFVLSDQTSNVFTVDNPALTDFFTGLTELRTRFKRPDSILAL